MAQVLADTQNNLYAYIYSDDHTPAHVHVFIGRKKSRSSKNIKINLGNNEVPPTIVLVHPSIKKTDIRTAWRLVVENQDMLLEQWNKIHGAKSQSKSSKRKTAKKLN